MRPENGGSKQSNNVSRLLLLGTAATYLYLSLFTFSNTPTLLEGDQNYFWAYALRMLQGDRAYRDFFQFTTPGTDLVFLALFRIFGPNIWVTDIAVIIVGVALCWASFDVSIRIMPRSWAILATLGFLVLIYGWMLDATHHWFGLLGVLSAARVLMPQRTIPRLALAGVLLGIASYFTELAGVAGAIGLLSALALERLFDRKPWRQIATHQLALLVFFGSTWGALSAYFIAQIGWKQIWYLWVVYPKEYVLVSVPLFRSPFSGQFGWHRLAALIFIIERASIYALLLLVYPLVWWRCWHQRREPSAAIATPLMMLSLAGCFLLLPAIARPNWGRLYMVFLPALILSVWFVAESRSARHYVRAMMWSVVALSALAQLTSRYRHSQMILDLPAGRAVVADADQYEKFSWLKQHTTPGDLFFQTAWLNTYFPLKLRSPVFVDALLPSEQTRPEQVALSVRQLAQKRVKYILWTPDREDPDYSAYYRADRLGPFRAYLLTHYSRVHVFSDRDEIWQADAEP
jgi:hypothetical protein